MPELQFKIAAIQVTPNTNIGSEPKYHYAC